TAAALLGLGQSQRAQEQIETLLASPELMASVIDPARLSLAAARLEPRRERRAEKMLEVMKAAHSARDDMTYLRAWIDFAHVQHQLGRDDEALVAARGSLAMARQMQLAEIEIDALTLISESVDPAEGLRLQEDALSLALKSGRTEDQFMLWSAQARQHQRIGDWMAARDAVEHADAAFLKLRTQLSSEEHAGLRDRLMPLASGRLGAGLLDPSLNAEQRADWVWARLESSRHWSSGLDLSRQAATHEDLRQLLVPPRDDRPVGAAELRQIEAQRFALEALDQRNPDDRWPDWRLIQATLMPGEMLLVVVADDPVSAALVLQADSAEVLKLGSGSELSQSQRLLLRGLGRQDPLGQGALRARVAHVNQLLGALPDRLASAASVSYLPGPGLEALPLELLLARPPAKLVRLSSGSLVQTSLTGGWRDFDPERVLVLQADNHQTAAVDRPKDWSDLPGTGDEVAQLLRYLPNGAAQVYRGSLAASAMLAQAPSSQFDLVHVAGHAFSNDYWSALDELAFGPTPDARVPLGSLRQHPWRAELVVLGACRTAYGAEGDLGLGFAQGFLQAGAKRVLASGWPVDDSGTAVFMDHFYTALLKDGMEPAGALAQAQAEMQSDPRWAAPYWWAGYHLWQPISTNALGELAAGH
ncbi:MAG: CHAT domain-containing protein, partial [Xanthomonadales bacterium]|nr:CHAT domain-containing protein [Xanthomonadales bacterium]